MIVYLIFGAFGGLGACIAMALGTENKSRIQGWVFATVWFVFLALIAATTPAATKPIAYLVDGDTGGPLPRYEERAKVIRHAKVIIDGLCLSACTMYLRRDWDLDVCYTQSALFGFHKPYMWLDNGPVTGISAINMSNATWRMFFFDQMPKGVQALLTGKQIPQPAAGDPIDRFLFIKARDLHGSIKRCADGWATKYDLLSVQDITTGIGAQ